MQRAINEFKILGDFATPILIVIIKKFKILWRFYTLPIYKLKIIIINLNL